LFANVQSLQSYRPSYKEYKLLIVPKSKIFYSTTTESFGNRIEQSRAMLLRLVQLDQSLAYIKLIIS